MLAVNSGESPELNSEYTGMGLGQTLITEWSNYEAISESVVLHSGLVEHDYGS
jgi:hypothetical protein